MPSIDPNFSYALPTLMFLPALFQVRDISDARDQVAIDVSHFLQDGFPIV